MWRNCCTPSMKRGIGRDLESMVTKAIPKYNTANPFPQTKPTGARPLHLNGNASRSLTIVPRRRSIRITLRLNCETCPYSPTTYNILVKIISLPLFLSKFFNFFFNFFFFFLIDQKFERHLVSILLLQRVTN